MHMTLSLRWNTLILCFALSCFLIQIPEWSYISQGIGFLAVFALCGFLISQSKAINFRLNSISAFAVVFPLFCCLSFLWTEIPYASLTALPVYLLLPVLILSRVLADEPVFDIRAFYWFIAGVGVIIAAVALYQGISGQGLYVGLANGPFVNPNSLAFFLGLTVIIITRLGFEKDNFQSYIVAALCCFLVMAAIFFTGSRSIIFVLFVIFIFMIIMDFFHRESCKKITLFYGSIFIFMSAAYGIVTHFSHIIQDHFHISVQSSFPRLSIWEGTMEAILSTNLWLGNGLGTFADIYQGFRHADDSTMGLHAHNDTLHLLLEIGVVGFTIIAFLIFGILGRFNYFLKEKSTILPLSIVMTCLLMAQLTPIISLPPLLMIFCLSLLMLYRDTGLLGPVRWIKGGFVIFVCLVACLTVQKMLEKYFIADVEKRLYAPQDVTNLVEIMRYNDLADQLSFYTHPAIPIFRSSVSLAIADVYEAHHGEKADLGSIENDLRNARMRNPYNADILFYRGQIALREGNIKKAEEFWMSTLSDDPRHIAARLALSDLLDDQESVYEILKAGLNYRYWKRNPKNLYARILIEAKVRRDEKTYQLAQKKIQNLLNRLHR